MGGSVSGHPGAAGAERGGGGVCAERSEGERGWWGGFSPPPTHPSSSSQIRLCLTKQSTGSENGHLSCKVEQQQTAYSHSQKSGVVAFLCKAFTGPVSTIAIKKVNNGKRHCDVNNEQRSAEKLHRTNNLSKAKASYY